MITTKREYIEIGEVEKRIANAPDGGYKGEVCRRCGWHRFVDNAENFHTAPGVGNSDGIRCSACSEYYVPGNA